MESEHPLVHAPMDEPNRFFEDHLLDKLFWRDAGVEHPVDVREEVEIPVYCAYDEVTTVW